MRELRVFIANLESVRKWTWFSIARLIYPYGFFPQVYVGCIDIPAKHFDLLIATANLLVKNYVSLVPSFSSFQSSTLSFRFCSRTWRLMKWTSWWGASPRKGSSTTLRQRPQSAPKAWWRRQVLKKKKQALSCLSSWIYLLWFFNRTSMLTSWTVWISSYAPSCAWGKARFFSYTPFSPFPFPVFFSKLITGFVLQNP